mmetsp:Transcript_31108/g.76810  ORF Transcript_31108/g.76810 Transcript_31108/m.76810 type:complete len:694 (-) Transcript_31108:154-2235(-)
MGVSHKPGAELSRAAVMQSTYSVQVPPGLQPGQPFLAMCGGQQVKVVVPPGAVAGSVFEVSVPAPSAPAPAMSVPVAQAQYAQVPASASRASSPVVVVVPGQVGNPPPPGYQPSNHEFGSSPVPAERRAGRGIGSANPPQDREEGEGNVPPRWSASCLGLPGLCARMPLTACTALLGLALVIAGASLQNVVRQRQTGTLWEVSMCCGTKDSADSANCDGTFVGLYPGPGLLCPSGSTGGEEQTIVLDLGQWQGDLFNSMPTRGTLALYMSDGNSANFGISLTKADGSTLLSRTAVNIKADDSRRRLSSQARTRFSKIAASSAAGGAMAPAGRRLLKGATSSGTTGGSTSTAGRTATTSSTSSGSTYSGTSRSTSTFGRSSTGGTYGGTASSGYGGFRGYSRGYSSQRYGLYGGTYLGYGYGLGATNRRRSGNSSTTGSQQQTAVDDELVRIEVDSVSVSALSSDFPLTLAIEGLSLTASDENIVSRAVDNPPFLFLGFATQPSTLDETLFQLGGALWSLGSGLLGLCFFRFLLGVFRLTHQKGGQPRYAEPVGYARFRNTIFACTSFFMFAALALLGVGIAVATFDQGYPKIGAYICIPLGLIMLLFGGRQFYKVDHMVYQLRRRGPVCTPLRAVANVLLCGALLVALIFSAEYDARPSSGTVIGLVVGCVFAAFAACMLWCDVKEEHLALKQ